MPTHSNPPASTPTTFPPVDGPSSSVRARTSTTARRPRDADASGFPRKKKFLSLLRASPRLPRRVRGVTESESMNSIRIRIRIAFPRECIRMRARDVAVETRRARARTGDRRHDDIVEKKNKRVRSFARARACDDDFAVTSSRSSPLARVPCGRRTPRRVDVLYYIGVYIDTLRGTQMSDR